MLHCAGTEDERNLRDVQTYLELYAGGGMPDTVCLVAALAPKLQAEEEDTRDPPGNVLPSLATTAAVVVVVNTCGACRAALQGRRWWLALQSCATM